MLYVIKHAVTGKKTIFMIIFISIDETIKFITSLLLKLIFVYVLKKGKQFLIFSL